MYLPRQDGIAVEHADLDVGDAALLDDLLGLSDALHLLRLQRHDVGPPVIVLICRVWIELLGSVAARTGWAFGSLLLELGYIPHETVPGWSPGVVK
jgi:hypothetical protein